MSNIVPYSDQEKMANAIAKSGLFGLREPNQVLALMAVAQAEGRHPASVAKSYATRTPRLSTPSPSPVSVSGLR